MAQDERIDSFVNRKAVESEKQFLMTTLDEILDKFGKVKSIKIGIEGAKNSADVVKGVKDMESGITELSKKSTAAKKSVDDLTLATKEYQKIIDQNATLQAKANASTSEAAKQNAALKLSTQEQNAALKDQVKLQQANEGSINKLRIELKQLQSQYDALGPAQRNALSGKELLKSIQATDQELKQLEGTTGRFQRNVGNYTGAVATLEKALHNVSDEIGKMNAAGNGNSEEVAKLKKEQEFLQQVLNKNVQGFASLTMEVRQNERALATMFAEGMKNTQAYKELEQQVSSAKRELGEFKEQQKILSSQTPAIAAATLAAKGLAGAYAVGAGAAALFGDEEGKIQKEVEKLVAIMTVLQGLQEVHELLEKKGTIAKVAGVIATQAQVAWQRILSTSMLQSAVATVALRVGLIALSGGLLLLLPLIASGATAMKAYAEKQENSKLKAEALNEVNKKANDQFADQSVKLQLLKDSFLKAGASARDKSEATKELNKEFGDYGVHLKNAQETEDFLVNKAPKFTEMLDLKAKATAAFSLATDEYKKALEAQTKADEEYLDNTDGVIVALKNTFSNFFSTSGDALANNAIDAVKVAEKNKKKEVDTATKKYDILKKLGEDYQSKAKAVGEKNGFELNNDQFNDQLKVIQETSRLEIQSIIDKNNRILNNEKSTFKERLEALKSNAAQQKKLSKVELDATENDPNKSDGDKLIARKKYGSDLAKIDADLKENLFRQQKDYDNKQAQLNAEINKTKIDQEIRTEQAIADNQNGTLESRLSAQQKVAEAQKSLIDQEYESQKRLLDQKASTSEEYVLIEAQRDAKIVELAASTEQKTIDILKSALDKKKQLQEDQAQEIQKQLERVNNSGTAQYASDVIALNQSLQDKAITVKQYNEKRAKLDAEYQLKTVANTAQSLQEQLKLYDSLGVERVGIEQSIISTEERLRNAKTDAEKKALQDKLDLLKKELAANQDNADKVGKITTDLENLKKEATEASTQKRIELLDQLKAKEKDLAEQVVGAIEQLISAGYDRQIDAIKARQDEVDKNKDAEIAAINAQALTAEEKAARIIIAEKRAQGEKDKLARKEKEIEVNKAKAEKASSLLKIVIDTITKTAQIKAQAALLLSNPITAGLAPFALAQIPFVIASGAISAALVAAQPIPKFKHGREDGPATMAIVGDGGKAEVIEYASGKTALTPATDTLTYLPAHAKVYPDVEAYQRASMAASFKQPVSFDKSLVDNDRYMKQMISESKLTREAIKGIPLKEIRLDENGFRLWVTNGSAQTEYINRTVKT
jgi:hypothetical protein